ncbi:MAG: beta-lactamase family protein [Acidobacteria bacterium]|nr:beta-lactamase family protein [Acidobacteriota bacterium]MYD70901.1 beta-lactamase family protein [Acidobacteriota bacterium]MYJ05522.1 beta-lactamase family protein [Acidobacteriota bacterium]
MKSRMRLTAFVVAFALLLVPQALVAQGLERVAPEEVGMSSERLDRLSLAIEEYVDEGRLAGAVAIVVRRGKIAYLEAIGHRDVDAQAPMPADAIFRIASQTKALASIGVMMLQEEGKLLITDPVGKYLPAFAETRVLETDDSGGHEIVAARRPINIRDLLTHTAGISYGMGLLGSRGPAADAWEEAGITGWYLADRDETVGETMARLADLPMDAHPGESWIYGYNTDILGAMIEKISGQTLEAFLKERLFDPLGMTDTHFFLPQDKVGRLATVYSSVDGGSGFERAPDTGTMVSQGHYVNGPRKAFSAGAGSLSTATDYATFLQMLLNGGEFNGTRILSRKTVESILSDHLGDIPFRPGQGFGLGFSIMHDPAAAGLPGSAGEFGWGGAYHSTYWADPKEEMVVVYLTQIIPAINLDDQQKLRTLVYQAIID